MVAGQRRHEKIPYAVRFRALLQFLDYRQSLPPLSTSLLRGIGLIMGPNHIVHEITDPITPHGFRGRHREIHIAVLDRKSVVVGKSLSVRVDLGVRGIIKDKAKIMKR